MIVTENLTKEFDGFVAVSMVNLQVEAGEVLALLGPNGAGKTTTVRMLTSILRPTSGWAKVAGFDVITEAEQVRSSVGVLTENHGLYNRMKAGEYLEFFGQIYGIEPKKRKERTYVLLEQFGLLSTRVRRIGEFSKGMRQKLALARALLHEPRVLLLDEPTSAMDPESARLVRDSIMELRSEERTIVICTHNLAEAEELADQIAIIRQGSIITQGKTAELKKNLLGPQEYQLQLGEIMNGHRINMPAGVELTQTGKDFIRFISPVPARDNPEVLRQFLEHGLPVISLMEVPRSLEQVYLQAINANQEELKV